MAPSTISQPNAKTFNPEEIVTEVLAGRVRVPSFQRKFRWQWEDVKRLFDSIAKGYPIGNLLLWERHAGSGNIQMGALDIDAPAGTALYVVDGQQRVTSLANALTAEGSGDPRFSLTFNLENETFEKYEPGSPPNLVPLYVIFDLQKLLSWFADHPELKPFLERATRLTKTIRQYAIPAYVVKQQDENVLRDIFDRMNNYGRRLSRAEVFSALHGGTAQAESNLHFYPEDKYHGTFETVAALIYRGRDTAALLEFVRRLAFNILICNGDAHLKNWSLIYRNPRVPTLAPAYDLVATSVYRPRESPETTGLKFCGDRRFERITGACFTNLQRKLGVAVSLKEEVELLVDRVLAAWPRVSELLRDHPAMRTAIDASIQKAATSLRK